MRLIGTTKQIALVEHLTKDLSKKGIDYVVDSKENLDWGSEEFGTITWSIWIVEEKEVPAARLLLLHLMNPALPAQPETQISLQKKDLVPVSDPSKRRAIPLLSACFLGLCLILFVIGFLTDKGSSVSGSLIRQHLFFDYPDALEACAKSHKRSEQLAFFPGYLPLLEYFRGDIKKTWKAAQSLPTFERIREGEVWRFFTPSLLHQDLFHLVFNMFWLLLLAPPLEKYLKPIRFLLFTLIAACVSNTAQYYMSGFTFLGASGVIAAYGGYLFSDIRNNQATLFTPLFEQVRFLFWMIIAFACFSFLEFLLSFFFSFRISISFANTAHCTGFAFGYLAALLSGKK